MNEYSDRDKEIGLDCYDPECRVFPEIVNKIGTGQELTKQDVLLILKWKLGLLKSSNSQTVTDRNLRRIKDAVRDARRKDRNAEERTATSLNLRRCRTFPALAWQERQ